MVATQIVNKADKEKIIEFTITYKGINCPTPTLYLYSDNTYEYYYTFTSEGNELIPKTGKYNYDITKIIKNVDKYEENDFGEYYIKDKQGKEYVILNTNIHLQELLNSLDITLDTCLVQQKNYSKK